MCGIVFYRPKNGGRASKAIIKRYQGQKTRGTEGFGHVKIKDGIVKSWSKCTHEAQALKFLKDSDEPGAAFLFHHRAPTSLPNLAGAAHPFRIEHKKLQYVYYIVVNGTVSNYKQMFEDYEKDGYVFASKVKQIHQWVFPNLPEEQGINPVNMASASYGINDSEAFAIDLAEFIEGQSTYIKSSGGLAFVGIQAEKDTGKVVSLFFGRNEGRPLIVESDKNMFSLKSEGQGVEIEPRKIFFMNLATEEIKEMKAPSLFFYNPKSHDEDHAPEKRTVEVVKPNWFKDRQEDIQMLPPPRQGRMGYSNDPDFISLELLRVNPNEIRKELAISTTMGYDIDADHIEGLLADLEIAIKEENEAVRDFIDAKDSLASEKNKHSNIAHPDYQNAVEVWTYAKALYEKANQDRIAAYAELLSHLESLDEYDYESYKH